MSAPQQTSMPAPHQIPTTASSRRTPMTMTVRTWFFGRFYSNQAQWSDNNLPAVIGMLDPPPGWYYEPMPRVRLQPNGMPVLSPHGLKVRNFQHLPHVLPNYQEIEGYAVEAYWRGHRDFQYTDIRARQPNGGVDYHNSAMSNKRDRKCRKVYPMLCWVLKAHGVTKNDVQVVERLTAAQVRHNTTWTVLPHGIQQPGNPSRILPLDYFLHDGQPHHPSERVLRAFHELVRLRTLARQFASTNWRELPGHLHPGYSRTKGQGVKAKAAALVAANQLQTPASSPLTTLPSSVSVPTDERRKDNHGDEEWDGDGEDDSFDASGHLSGIEEGQVQNFKHLREHLGQESHDIDAIVATQLGVAGPLINNSTSENGDLVQNREVLQDLLDPAMFETMSQVPLEALPDWCKSSQQTQNPTQNPLLSTDGLPPVEQHQDNKRRRTPDIDEGYVSALGPKQIKRRRIDANNQFQSVQPAQQSKPDEMLPNADSAVRMDRGAVNQSFQMASLPPFEDFGAGELGFGPGPTPTRPATENFPEYVPMYPEQIEMHEQYLPFQPEYFPQPADVFAGFGTNMTIPAYDANPFGGQQQQYLPFQQSQYESSQQPWYVPSMQLTLPPETPAPEIPAEARAAFEARMAHENAERRSQLQEAAQALEVLQAIQATPAPQESEVQEARQETPQRPSIPVASVPSQDTPAVSPKHSDATSEEGTAQTGEAFEDIFFLGSAVQECKEDYESPPRTLPNYRF